MTLPTFFIIGAAKAGTTSLHHYLDQHPEVQMSAIKEPNFFAGPPNGIPYPVGRVERLDEYEGLFDASFEVRGEASPSYSSFPRRRRVPERIAEAVPDAKFIYVVRDPIARAISQHQMRVGGGQERRPLSEVLTDLDDADPYSFFLTCQGFYARQLERYLRHFPGERVMVVDHADLLARREETLREIFGFLAVDEEFTSPQFQREANRASEKKAYPGFVQTAKPVIARPFRRLPRGARERLRSAFERPLATVPAPVLEREDRAQLEQLYASDVERLRALTGTAFSSWSV